MRIKASKKKENGSCGDRNYRVLLYSRRASLVKEFCFDPQENEVADLQEAEQLLCATLTPCDFAAMTVTLVGGEGSDKQEFVQFDLREAEQASPTDPQESLNRRYP
jgi:hypothetical protein